MIIFEIYHHMGTHQLLDILKPDKFYIVTPGVESYTLEDGINVRGLYEAAVSF